MSRILTNFIFVVILLCTSKVLGQNVTVNPGAVSYATLKASFDAINAGTHTGIITIDIVGNTTEAASAVLNASGSGSASYSSITISPGGGAARTISGTVFNPLIDLNGADNVTIDGLNSGSNSLTISNTGTTSASTIRFINDATNNTIQKCTINGSSIFQGVITFVGGTVSGNDGNNINNCNIGPAGGTSPGNGVYSMGTSSANDNSGNTISNNNIYDFFNPDLASNGININSNNSTWIITDNKIYQTATRTYSTGSVHNGIFITSGSGYNISGNVIGYSNSSGTGTYTMTGTVATRFVGINLGVGTASATSVQGNTIAGFSLNTSSNASTTNGIWCGINLSSGDANIGAVTGNIIGNGNSTGSITTTSSGTDAITVGINSSSSGLITISNNTIGSITANGSTTSIAVGITAIQVTAGTTPTITYNTIGSTSTANSINSATLATTGTQRVFGINVPSSGSVTTATNISNNTIANMNQAGNLGTSFIRGILYGGTGFGTISSNVVYNISGNTRFSGVTNGSTGVQGICYSGASPSGASISLNTVYAISAINTGSDALNLACGIGYANPTGGVITRNTIYDIRNASTGSNPSAPPMAIGLLLMTWTTSVTVSNNMITIGDSQTGNIQCMGIMNRATSTGILNLYYNSICIIGTVSSGTALSFAFVRGSFSTPTSVSTPVNLRNNIFTNSRSGGTGSHYALANYGSAADTAGWGVNASDYNILNSPSSSTIGIWKVASQDFSSWKASSYGDNNSRSGITINFNSTALGNLHLSGGSIGDKNLQGTPIAGITVDIDNDNRLPEYPYIGADEIPSSPLALKLNLTVLIQGYYKYALDNAIPMIPDTVKVYLANTSAPYAIVDSAMSVFSVSGVVILYFPKAIGTNYYLIARHRNSMETWSALPQTFLSSETTYNFTDLAAKALGNNMVLIGVGGNAKWCLFSGDVNQDGYVETYDLNATYDDNVFGITGYVVTDLNGDLFTETEDLNLVFDNNVLGIEVKRPLDYPFTNK